MKFIQPINPNITFIEHAKHNKRGINKIKINNFFGWKNEVEKNYIAITRYRHLREKKMKYENPLKTKEEIAIKMRWNQKRINKISFMIFLVLRKKMYFSVRSFEWASQQSAAAQDREARNKKKEIFFSICKKKCLTLWI